MNAKTESRALTQEGRIEVFRIATRSLEHWYGEQFKAGMTDAELKTALSRSLGIFGGSCGPDCLSVSYTGAGLRIWGAWHTVNHCVEKPLFSGTKTMAMAREVYSIANPDTDQRALL